MTPKTATALPLKRPGPKGGKRDENRQRRRQSLLDAALPLFLAHGIEAVTIDQIVERTGVAKGSFYRYFSDKRALVDALLEPVRAALREALSRCEAAISAARGNAELLAAYQGLATTIAFAIFTHRDVVLLYLQEWCAPKVGARAPMVELGEELAEASLRLTRAAENGGLLRPLNARVTSLAVLGAIDRLLYHTLKGEPMPDAEATSNALISMVMDGLRPGGGGGLGLEPPPQE
jgi:AcrR family transcriptional regulator